MAIHDAFTKAEDGYLIQNYPIKPWGELIEEINKISPVPRSKQSLLSRASELGVKRTKAAFGRFTKEEDEIIIRTFKDSKDGNVGENISKMIAQKMPNRTVSSVLGRASKLGLKIREPWSEEDEQFLIDNYYTMTSDEIAIKLSRTPEAIHNRVRKLGLKGAPMYKYTQEDKDYVRANYLTMSDQELGDVLHRKAKCIKELRRKLGLQRVKIAKSYYDFDKFIHRNNNEWKKISAKNCDYKCVISGESFDDIHHLFGKNMIIEEMLIEHPEFNDINFSKADEKEKQKVLDCFLRKQQKYPLGVCLKQEYHKAFHQEYGFGNNTPEQFYEFVKKVAPDRLDYIMNL